MKRSTVDSDGWVVFGSYVLAGIPVVFNKRAPLKNAESLHPSSSTLGKDVERQCKIKEMYGRKLVRPNYKMISDVCFRLTTGTTEPRGGTGIGKLGEGTIPHHYTHLGTTRTGAGYRDGTLLVLLREWFLNYLNHSNRRIGNGNIQLLPKPYRFVVYVLVLHKLSLMRMPLLTKAWDWNAVALRPSRWRFSKITLLRFFVKKSTFFYFDSKAFKIVTFSECRIMNRLWTWCIFWIID